MNYEILANNALHFPNLLETPEEYVSFCTNEAALFDVPKEAWVAGGDDSQKVYGELWVLQRSHESDRVKSLLAKYDKALLTSCEEFMRYLGVDQEAIDATIESLKNNRMPAMTVKRYFEGESLGPHPDIDPSNAEDVLHVTVSMYYNDNYEGGELGVIGGSSVKPTPGSVVIFPSKYLHESTTIPSGIKYVSNEVVRLDSSFLKEL
jgi:predicted 2-oxoglutarate/Fe(II)-dependent dioxygenase YbiX